MDKLMIKKFTAFKLLAMPENWIEKFTTDIAPQTRLNKKLTATQEGTKGFVSVLPSSESLLLTADKGLHVLGFKTLTRKVDASALNARINEKKDEFLEREGFEYCTSEQMADIKDNVLAEIYPKLPPTPQGAYLFINEIDGIVFTTSTNNAFTDKMTAAMREVIGEFPIVKLEHGYDKIGDFEDLTQSLERNKAAFDGNIELSGEDGVTIKLKNIMHLGTIKDVVSGYCSKINKVSIKDTDLEYTLTIDSKFKVLKVDGFDQSVAGEDIDGEDKQATFAATVILSHNSVLNAMKFLDSLFQSQRNLDI